MSLLVVSQKRTNWGAKKGDIKFYDTERENNMSLETITEEILALNLRIKELEKLREEELKRVAEVEWYKGNYEKLIYDGEYGNDYITVNSNYKSYEIAKKENRENYIYLSVTEENSIDYDNEKSTSLNTKTAKELISYLTKVVNYMEDK